MALMIERTDIDQLASLARLELTDNEKDKLLSDLESILGYVSELSSLAVDPATVSKGQALVENILRPDGEVLQETGVNTELLVSSAPVRLGDFVKVKGVFDK